MGSSWASADLFSRQICGSAKTGLRGGRVLGSYHVILAFAQTHFFSVWKCFEPNSQYPAALGAEPADLSAGHESTCLLWPPVWNAVIKNTQTIRSKTPKLGLYTYLCKQPCRIWNPNLLCEKMRPFCPIVRTQHGIHNTFKLTSIPLITPIIFCASLMKLRFGRPSWSPLLQRQQQGQTPLPPQKKKVWCVLRRRALLCQKRIKQIYQFQ